MAAVRGPPPSAVVGHQPEQVTSLGHGNRQIAGRPAHETDESSGIEEAPERKGQLHEVTRTSPW